MTKKHKREQRKQYLLVIHELVSRETKRKYARSKLGILWSVLNPLLSMAVLSMIFSTIFKRSIENYPIYYLTGFIIWNMFTLSTNTAMTALVDNKQLLIKVKLPMLIFPISRVLTALVNLGYSLVAYAVMLVVFRVQFSWKMLFLPVVVFFLLLFSLGISYILSVAYVFFGDIKHLYSVITTLWMYCSAIFYPVDAIDPVLKMIVEHNPVYNFIACARDCMMYQQLPNMLEGTQLVVWGIGMYLVGILVFNKFKNKIMQVI